MWMLEWCEWLLGQPPSKDHLRMELVVEMEMYAQQPRVSHHEHRSVETWSVTNMVRCV